MKKKSGNGRKLSKEEKKLWEFITRSDRPLHKINNENVADMDDEVLHVPAIKRYKTSAPPPVPSRAVRKKSTPSLGHYANVDGTTAERLRKGNYPIDATLDLHGMTAEKAHVALKVFIAAQYKRKHRCLLIITGKGKSGEGVLRQMLPRWLADDFLALEILAFDVAKTKHGGSGAFYVLLRRQR